MKSAAHKLAPSATPCAPSTLKKNYNLVEVVSSTVSLKNEGKLWRGPCPFHAETKGSFVVDADHYHCFGCGAHGDIFTWLMWSHSCSFARAIEILGGTPLAKRRESTRETLIESSETREIYSACVSYFQNRLWNSFDARLLAEKRTNQRTMKTFHIGFAPSGGRSCTDYLLRRGFSPEGLVAAGISRELNDGLIDRFVGRIMIPLLEGTECVGFIGRSTRLTPKNQSKYLLPSRSSGFNKKRFLFGMPQADLSRGHIIAVEGAFDCIALHEAGIRNVVALLGCSPSECQLELLHQSAAKVWFMFDGDAAGLTAAAHTAFDERDNRFILLSDNADPDTMWQESGTLLSLKKKLLNCPRVTSFELQGFKLTIPRRFMFGEDYDSTALDDAARPYCQSNLEKGWPHYNCVDFVMSAHPEFADEIRLALHTLRDTAEKGDNGKKHFTKEAIVRFIHAWKKPCQKVREMHRAKQKREAL